MIPDPRFNTGYQPQQQQQVVQQMPPQHHYQKPMYSYRPSWSDSHINTNAAWIAIGPSALYTIGFIMLGILFASVAGGGDFDLIFASFMLSGLYFYLFISIIISIFSTVIAFTKKCPKIWMIVGPGIGFALSIVTYILSILLIVDEFDLDEIVDDIFGGGSIIELMVIGFIIHTVMAFGSMMLMVLASNNEQY